MDLNLNLSSTAAAAAILIFTLSLSSQFHPAQGVDCYKCNCLKVTINPNPATTPPPPPAPPGRRRRRRRRRQTDSQETDKEICSGGCVIYTTLNGVLRGCKDSSYATLPGTEVPDCKGLTLYEGDSSKAQKCTCSANDCNSKEVIKVPITQRPCGEDCDEDDAMTPPKLSLPLFFASLLLLPLIPTHFLT